MISFGNVGKVNFNLWQRQATNANSVQSDGKDINGLLHTFKVQENIEEGGSNV